MGKAIVTGANGFIGAAVCKKLVENGISVFAVVRNEKSDISGIKDLPNLHIVYCDLHNILKLCKIIDGDGNIDAFYHFAWESICGTERGNYEVQIQNVKYACDAVMTCAALKCKRFILASSIMEYEVEKMMQMQYELPISTLYSSAKLAASYACKAVANNENIEFLRAVISNIYGPGEKNMRLINATLRKMLMGEKCLFTEGKQLYDLIYVEDAANAFVQLMYGGTSGKTYYIGTEHPRPLREYLTEMRNIVNPKLEIEFGKIPYNGVSLSYEEFDKEALRKDTGFEIKVDFACGIKKTIAEILKEEEICLHSSLKK